MSFTELNSVEHFIIERLAGVNLNQVKSGVARVADSAMWRYVPSDLLAREITDVLLEKELKAALCDLNPDIKANPSFADEVIHKLRAILITVSNVGLVRANEESAKWLRGEQTMPFGAGGKHVAVKLIDFETIKNNDFLLTNQFRIFVRETKIPDIVMFVNGIPLVICEAKTPVRPAVSWFDAAYEIHQVYENSVPSLFVPNVFSFATEGKELYIGSVRMPLELWSPWRLQEDKDALSQFVGLGDVGKQLKHLLNPATLLDILQYFTVYATNSKRKK